MNAIRKAIEEKIGVPIKNASTVRYIIDQLLSTVDAETIRHMVEDCE